MDFTELPFEYEIRYGEQFPEWGIPMEQAAHLEERDRQLEDFLASFNRPVLVIDVGDGAVPTGHTKAHWVGRPGSLARVTATLSVAGSTDTVASILRDGSSIGTVTIPAGDQVVTVEVGEGFDADSFWQMQQTTAGTGAGGLTYFGEFM